MAAGANLYAKNGIYEKCRVVPQLQKMIANGSRVDRHCTSRGTISMAYDRNREQANAVLKGGIRETGRNQLGKAHAVERTAENLHVKHRVREFADGLNSFLTDGTDPKSRRARSKKSNTSSTQYVESHPELLIGYAEHFNEGFDQMYREFKKIL